MTMPSASRTAWRLAFALAIAGVVVSVAFALLPFTVAGSSDHPELSCGPAPYELLVPPDAAVPSPEDGGCDTPARQRLFFAGAGLAVALAAAIGVRRLDRVGDARADAAWLASHGT